MDNIKVLLTKDGSHTVYNCALDESYHAYNGALTESEYVYIEHGLNYYLQQSKHPSNKNIRILEFGFGTGLNTILTLAESRQSDCKIHYTSAEPYPLPDDVIRHLNHGQLIKNDFEALFNQVHNAKWDEDVNLTDAFTIHKAHLKIEELPNYGPQFDILFYDAFAPSKQPEAWTFDVLKRCSDLLSPEGLLVTYCANGQFKRNLKSLGFELVQIEGPMGRKEMTRAWKVKE